MLCFHGATLHIFFMKVSVTTCVQHKTATKTSLAERAGKEDAAMNIVHRADAQSLCPWTVALDSHLTQETSVTCPPGAGLPVCFL